MDEIKLGRCIRHNEKIYGIGQGGKIVVVTINDIDPKDCPACVIEALTEIETETDENCIRLQATEDDSIYLFNYEKYVAKKLCYILNAEEYPPSIIRQIRELKKNAPRLPDV
jgi:hypothetical protein